MNLSDALQKAVGSCAEPYYKHQRRLERERRVPRDYSYFARPARVTLQERLFALFPRAYEKASDGGRFTPDVRQLYYVVRQMLQAAGCNEELSDSYHRRVLEDYEIAVAGERLCHRKAVGHMIEPHGDCPTCGQPAGVALGTRAVLQYTVPRHRFNKILYVEKTGFMNQLVQEGVHEQFDIAIAAGAGFAPEAAKELFAEIEKTIPVTVYVLHDADIAGCEIGRTLGSTLVHEHYRVNVVDLGLRPAEAMALGLPSESVNITSEPSYALQKMLPHDELQWLLGQDVRDLRNYGNRSKVLYRGTRVELNAFTPREFVDWVTDKLEQLEGKVIPDSNVIAQEVIAQRDAQVRERVAGELLKAFDLDRFLGNLPPIARPSEKEIVAELEKAPRRSWRDVVRASVTTALDGILRGDDTHEHVSPRRLSGRGQARADRRGRHRTPK